MSGENDPHGMWQIDCNSEADETHAHLLNLIELSSRLAVQLEELNQPLDSDVMPLIDAAMEFVGPDGENMQYIDINEECDLYKANQNETTAGGILMPENPDDLLDRLTEKDAAIAELVAVLEGIVSTAKVAPNISRLKAIEEDAKAAIEKHKPRKEGER